MILGDVIHIRTTSVVKTYSAPRVHVRQRITVNERKFGTLRGIRDALLSELLSGELWVTRADRIVERVV